MSKENGKITDTELAQAKGPKNITEVVQNKVADMTRRGEIVMPADYSPENALKSAWLKLQEVEDKNHNKALDICTKGSIANSLLDMVVQGLTPGKNQCYFVVYGKRLTLTRSYMGTIAVAKRFSDVTDVYANCVYEGDTFKYQIDPKTGLKEITVHEQDFMNIDINKIKGAYAVILRRDKAPYVEVMTWEQIKKAWGQGATKGNSPAHKNFAEEMAKKTVINRACKLFVNTSSDAAVLVEAFNNTSEADYSRDRDKTYYDADSDVVIDVDDRDLTDAAAAEVFGGMTREEPEDRLTEEEKAEIEAMEAEQAGEADAVDQR